MVAIAADRDHFRSIAGEEERGMPAAPGRGRGG